MSKLHELIAVEKDVKAAAEKSVKETHSAFTSDGSIFAGFNRLYEPLKDGDTDIPVGESKKMVTTVNTQLDTVNKRMTRMFDCLLQKELSNSEARGTITIGDFVQSDIPVTFLIQIEKKLEELKNQVYNSIPTLNPSVEWKFDENEGVHRAKVQERTRTKKLIRSLSVAKATKEHPEQVQMYNEDTPIGKWVTFEWSGLITNVEKRKLLERVNILISEVKRARARANSSEVAIAHIGERIFNYITNG